MNEIETQTETNGSGKGKGAVRAEGREAKVQWDDSAMVTVFANVVNIQSTREQVDLFVGTNQTWNPQNDGAVTVELSNRVILTPHAAKRLSVALAGVMQEYESRHGKLTVEGG